MLATIKRVGLMPNAEWWSRHSVLWCWLYCAKRLFSRVQVDVTLLTPTSNSDRGCASIRTYDEVQSQAYDSNLRYCLCTGDMIQKCFPVQSHGTFERYLCSRIGHQWFVLCHVMPLHVIYLLDSACGSPHGTQYIQHICVHNHFRQAKDQLANGTSGNHPLIMPLEGIRSACFRKPTINIATHILNI
jgi:hypothetical protein